MAVNTGVVVPWWKALSGESLITKPEQVSNVLLVTPPHTLSSGKQAVVIGGSLAGLLAVRVLLNHFEKVTLFDECDCFPQEPTPRRGIPQVNQVHVILHSRIANSATAVPRPKGRADSGRCAYCRLVS